jgi:hypothetical protein
MTAASPGQRKPAACPLRWLLVLCLLIQGGLAQAAALSMSAGPAMPPGSFCGSAGPPSAPAGHDGMAGLGCCVHCHHPGAPLLPEPVAAAGPSFRLLPVPPLPPGPRRAPPPRAPPVQPRAPPAA